MSAPCGASAGFARRRFLSRRFAYALTPTGKKPRRALGFSFIRRLRAAERLIFRRSRAIPRRRQADISTSSAERTTTGYGESFIDRRYARPSGLKTTIRRIMPTRCCFFSKKKIFALRRRRGAQSEQHYIFRFDEISSIASSNQSILEARRATIYMRRIYAYWESFCGHAAYL